MREIVVTDKKGLILDTLQEGLDFYVAGDGLSYYINNEGNQVGKGLLGAIKSGSAPKSALEVGRDYYFGRDGAVYFYNSPLAIFEAMGYTVENGGDEPRVAASGRSGHDLPALLTGFKPPTVLWEDRQYYVGADGLPHLMHTAVPPPPVNIEDSDGSKSKEAILSEEVTYLDKNGRLVILEWNISNETFLKSGELTQEQITEICLSNNAGLVERGFDIAIYQLSQAKSINPKIILATLAQEQSWCRNGGYQRAFGIGPGGNPTSFSEGKMGGLEDAVDIYLRLFYEGKTYETNGNMPTILVNYDPYPYRETRAVFGNDIETWQNNNRNYVEYMENGIKIQPINAAMYAKLRYTPWLDFPPQNSQPLATWLNLVNSF
jgi:hypothetical protein